MNIYNSEYTKNHWVPYLKWVNCRVCELYINTVIKKINEYNNWNLKGDVREYREVLIRELYLEQLIWMSTCVNQDSWFSEVGLHIGLAPYCLSPHPNYHLAPDPYSWLWVGSDAGLRDEWILEKRWGCLFCILFGNKKFQKNPCKFIILMFRLIKMSWILVYITHSTRQPLLYLLLLSKTKGNSTKPFPIPQSHSGLQPPPLLSIFPG